MQKVELVRRFQAFTQQQTIQVSGELELVYYLMWYCITQVHNEHVNTSIIPDLPRHVGLAMKYLRESSDPQVSQFRQLYLAARGQQAVPDLNDISPTNVDRQPTISMISRLIERITGDNSVRNSIEAWYKQLADARQNHRDVYRRYLMLEAEQVRNYCVIVQKGSYFYHARPDKNRHHPNAAYWFRYAEYGLIKKVHTYDFSKMRIEEFTRSDSENLPVQSFDELVTYYCQAFRGAWFQVENTLRNTNCWQYQRNQVWYHMTGYGGYERDQEGIAELDTWTLRPGIERTWYTDVMLEAELSKRFEILYSKDPNSRSRNPWEGGQFQENIKFFFIDLTIREELLAAGMIVYKLETERGIKGIR